MSNDKVYIHEYIDITKQGRAKYMHHMTANWSPLAQEQRGQLCYGVWGTVGSTGRWPQVVNLWEEDGWDGLTSSFAHELADPSLQDPALATWWATAADLRSGGVDRILVPHPSTRTIEELCRASTTYAAYAHEMLTVEPGRADEFLDLAVDGVGEASDSGWVLIGAFRTAMRHDEEALLLWGIPDWPSWGKAERRMAERAADAVPSAARELLRSRERILLVDAPLSPLRTHRQPHREDRTGWQD
ncbi:MAG: hypothetical protein JWL79_3186 [Frankiales bacterium]|nr:hypothetical protein [Frankiales bacterium]